MQGGRAGDLNYIIKSGHEIFDLEYLILMVEKLNQ